MDPSRWNPAVERHWLLLIAGLLWTTVGVMLSALASGWLAVTSSNAALPFSILGIAAALAVYRFGFSRLALKNIARISASAPRVCVFAFQAWRSYLLIGVMMTLGMVLRDSPIPRQYLAVLYFGIGGGLLLSSLHYYRRLLDLARAL